LTTKPSTIDLSSLGLGTGYSSTNIVTTLVALKKAPITALQTTQSSAKAAATALSTFSSKLAAVKTAAKDLSDPTAYEPFAATTTGSGVVASTSGASVAASYLVQVSQLAQAQRTVSDPQASSTAALGQSGTLSLTINGTRSDVTISPDQSLASIATALSRAARVSAAVVFDGSRYRLQVRGLDTGAASAIDFSEADGVDLGLGKPSNTSLQAQDAVATVDGLTVTSPTNQVKGALDGVSLAFSLVTPSPVTVTVAPDASALSSKVGALVSAYNAVVSFAHANAGYGSTAATNSLLQSDHAMQSALNTLKKLMTAPASSGSGAYTTPASVGLKLANDGTVSLDQNNLTTAVQSDPTTVRALFVTDHASGANGVMKSFASAIDSLTTNFGAPVAAEVSRFNARASSLDKSISTAQRRLDAYQAQLEAKFNSASTTITSNRSLYSQVGGTGKFI
jgi:flagellar hook-associated protein 2